MSPTRPSCRARPAVLVLAAALGACTVGPDFRRPAPPAVDGYTAQPLPAATAAADVPGGVSQRFVAGGDIPAQWWTLFRSPLINDLIAQAFAANPDVAAAQAALKRANEDVLAQQGELYPRVDGNLSAGRQRQSQAGTGGFGPTVYNLFNASVGVSYALDVWGGTRRQIEALRAQADYERFQLEATYLTLAANVVTTAVQIASLRAQVAVTNDIIGIQEEQLGVLRRQFDLGAIAVSDVLAQEAALAQLRATLPTLQKSLAQTYNQLAALVGRFPSEDGAHAFDVSTLHLPEFLPVSLPSKLVEQRPDVRAAEALLQSASAQVGVATANLLPQITLSADYGRAATEIGSLFSSGMGFWSIAAGLTQPIFNGQQLEHQRRAALATFDQAAAQYKSTVLAAFQNVADALRALQFDADSLASLRAAEQSAVRSLDLARTQFSAGAINYLTLLNAQRTLQDARLNLVQAQARRFADTAALFQSLGGGWWNRADVTVARD